MPESVGALAQQIRAALGDPEAPAPPLPSGSRHHIHLPSCRIQRPPHDGCAPRPTFRCCSSRQRARPPVALLITCPVSPPSQACSASCAPAEHLPPQRRARAPDAAVRLPSGGPRAAGHPPNQIRRRRSRRQRLGELRRGDLRPAAAAATAADSDAASAPGRGPDGRVGRDARHERRPRRQRRQPGPGGGVRLAVPRHDVHAGEARAFSLLPASLGPPHPAAAARPQPNLRREKWHRTESDR